MITIKPPVTADHIDEANRRRRAERAAILKLAHLRRRVAAAASIPGGLRERLEQALVELEALD